MAVNPVDGYGFPLFATVPNSPITQDQSLVQTPPTPARPKRDTSG